MKRLAGRLLTHLNPMTLVPKMKRLGLLTAFTISLVLFASNQSVEATEVSTITFADQIAPIIHSKCSNCHRSGQPGPLELLEYVDVKERGQTIQAVINDRYMPPWKPVNQGVDFAHDRRLSKQEIKWINQWVEQGMPSGNLSKVNTPTYSSDWSLGTPDLVLKMSGRFEVPASGKDIYRSFVFPAALPEDKWVKAIELRPTARSAVHHALFYVDTSGEARRRDGEDGKAGLSGMSFLRNGRSGIRGNIGSRFGRQREKDNTSGVLIRGLGGYIPGSMPNKLPGDLAMALPKGGDIVMQTHFHPSGKVEWEEAELALYFADKPPSRQLVPIQLPPLFGRFAGIDVAAGDDDFEITQSYVLPVDVEAIQIGGHAHYICREMELHAVLPDGEKIDLLTIDDWDLDWQDQYQFDQPISLPAGTKLDARIRYDNSAENPENPYSPPKRIQWGRESTDEMGSVTLQVVAKNEADRPTLQKSTRTLLVEATKKQIGNRLGQAGQSIRTAIQSGFIKRLDQNGDGQLQEDEVPERYRQRAFRADLDKNKILDESELKLIEQFLNRGGSK